MTRKRFSRDADTFRIWHKRHPGKNTYERWIIKLHEFFPDLTLAELRRKKLSDAYLSDVPWNELTDSQKEERKTVFELLNRMQEGESFTEAITDLGLDEKTAKKHAGENLFKRKKRYRVRKHDTIQRKMPFYSGTEGKISIIVSNSEDASLIGEYFARKKIALDRNDESELGKFKGVAIIDANSVQHEFETDLQTILELESQIERPEFFEIYSD